MTAHELAKLLLAGPNLPVIIPFAWDEEGYSHAAAPKQRQVIATNEETGSIYRAHYKAIHEPKLAVIVIEEF